VTVKILVRIKTLSEMLTAVYKYMYQTI